MNWHPRALHGYYGVTPLHLYLLFDNMADDIRYCVDHKARRFLSAVQHYGGDASMTDIRRHTGLTRDEANHRFRRLEELGLIDITRAESGLGDREPPKVAHLTGTARREIERGLLYNVQEPRNAEEADDIRSEVRALRKAIERLEQRLHVMDETVRATEDHVEDLDSFLRRWVEVAEPRIIGMQTALREGVVPDIDEHIERARQD